MVPGQFVEGKSRLEGSLLEMAEVVVRHDSISSLLPELSQRLSVLVPLDVVSISLPDSARNLLRLHYWQKGAESSSHDVPTETSPSGWVWRNRMALNIPNVHEERKVKTSLEGLCKTGIYSYCVLPLLGSQGCLGALGIGSLQVSCYGEQDVRFLERIAKIVALAIERMLNLAALRNEKERLQMLLEVNSTLVSSLNVQKLFPAISEFIRAIIGHELSFIALHDPVSRSLHKFAFDWPSCPDLFRICNTDSLEGSASEETFLKREVKVFNREELQKLPSVLVQKGVQDGIESVCCIPLMPRDEAIGVFTLGSRDKNSFVPQNIALLTQIGSQIAIALDNDRAYREISALKDKLAEEKLYLQGEIKSVLNFDEIVGESKALQSVLENVKTVAPNDATVLILGETGTGKELIAHAIHRMSSRNEGGFIKVNCAAIPTGLLESELFGHEKGAFTGAVTQKVGRLELAHKGTIFLDEIGEIPLELQPKLLRVLQDHEFERLGGTRTIRVDVRLIAATNRDLEKSVVQKEFRSDLYYRLNVFPVRLPALRERRSDIPLLVRYFSRMYAKRFNKIIESIPSETMEQLVKWDWPGNVRELENFIERSVILSPGPVLRAPLAELRHGPQEPVNGNTLEFLERQHVIQALREAGGVISGENGAALRLGLKRTTLQSMIQRMRISPEEYQV